MNDLINDPRLWGNIEADGDCWIWTGKSRDRGGYARWSDTRNDRKLWRVHRLTYQVLIGEIPDGLTLDHLCCRKLCVNPYHMDPTPIAVNQGRWVAARTHCLKGGHEVKPENLYIRPNGSRECRPCRRRADRVQ